MGLGVESGFRSGSAFFSPIELFISSESAISSVSLCCLRVHPFGKATHAETVEPVRLMGCDAGFTSRDLHLLPRRLDAADVRQEKPPARAGFVLHDDAESRRV